MQLKYINVLLPYIRRGMYLFVYDIYVLNNDNFILFGSVVINTLTLR